ncbi:MAG: ferrous iron transporter B [Fibrobacteres bacterium]|nr:ferrous iron transporter B [Fibrobacterota bacterium]
MSNSEAPKIVVLLGAPNSGKTSLYNHLTGSRYKTVNYPGATVEYSMGKLRAPGEPTRAHSHDADCHPPAHGLSIEQGTVQIMDTPGIVSIVARSQDEQVALSALSSLDTVIGTSYRSPHLLVVLLDATQPARHLPLVREVIKAGFPTVVALTMNDLARKKGWDLDPNKLSESIGAPVVEVDGRTGVGISDLVSSLEALLPEQPAKVTLPSSVSEALIQDNFRWADHVAARAIRNGSTPPASVNPGLGRIDRIVMHPVLGLLVFIAVMTGLFWSVFSASAPFMDFTEGLFGSLGEWVGSMLGEGWLKGLLVDGIIAGGGAVFVFVPQIAILFLALGILEDSGYLARGAMIIDRFLVLIGLNGKSFVPLLSGAACAIPAAMAARTIPGRRERYLTLLVIPLMSCSARLPVWGLLLGFLVPPDRPLWGGLALTGIYLLSLVFASAVAVVGGKILRIEPSHTGFQVELPMWRPPTFRTVVVSAWDRTVSYVKRAGLTILAVSVAFWVFMTFPSPENSAMMMLGKLLDPVFTPMGLDWKVGVALIAAFAAREVFVSALAVVYSVQGTEDSTDGLLEVMRQATFEGTSQMVFTPSSVAGLIVFFLIALQCLTTVAVMRKEVSNRFALGQLCGFVLLAWILAVATVQGLRLVGVP